jgi:hypothetical protein
MLAFSPTRHSLSKFGASYVVKDLSHCDERANYFFNDFLFAVPSPGPGLTYNFGHTPVVILQYVERVG